jgi:hypothetical protein
MSTAVQRATSAAQAATRRLRGEAVTYRHGVITIGISNAVRGSTNWDRNAVHPNVRIGDRSTDWLIESAQLVHAGTPLEPQRDATITTADGTVYRVLPMGGDRQLWQWHDRDAQTTYRIHTKERS